MERRIRLGNGGVLFVEVVFRVLFVVCGWVVCAAVVLVVVLDGALYPLLVRRRGGSCGLRSAAREVFVVDVDFPEG